MPYEKLTVCEYNAHEKGNTDCPSCDPKPCDEEGCTGLIHSEYVDEDWDNIYYQYKCDECS